jgi:hypothetical protein
VPAPLITPKASIIEQTDDDDPYKRWRGIAEPPCTPEQLTFWVGLALAGDDLSVNGVEAAHGKVFPNKSYRPLSKWARAHELTTVGADGRVVASNTFPAWLARNAPSPTDEATPKEQKNPDMRMELHAYGAKNAEGDGFTPLP